MATTISTLKFMITADAGGLVEGVTLTKRELREASKIAEQAQTPFQQYGDKLDRLKMLHAGGGLDAAQYRQALNGVHQEMLSGVPILGQFTAFLNPIALGFAAITAAATITGATIAERLSSLDELGDQAARLNADPSGLSRLSIAAKFGDVDEATVFGALKKLQVELGKAASGNKEAAQTFDDLGVSVEEAVRMDSVSQFNLVAEAIAKVPTHAEKLSVISKVMGKASTDVVTFIDDLDRLNAMADESGGIAMTSLVDKAGEFDLATKKLSVSWQGLGNTMTDIAAGPLTAIVDKSTEVLKEPAGSAKGLKIGALWGPFGALVGGAISQGKSVVDSFASQDTSAVNASVSVKDLGDAHRDAAIRASEHEESTERLTKAEVKADEASRKYLDGLRERLQLVGANTEAVTRFNAAKAGLSFQETAEAVRIVRETEERNKEIASRKEWADELERGETALRAEAEAAAKSVEDPMSAAGKRVGRFAELRDFGLLDDAQLKALTRKEAAGLVRDIPAGVQFAEKGSAAARQAVIESKQGDRQVKALERSVKLLEEIAKKEAVTVMELGE